VSSQLTFRPGRLRRVQHKPLIDASGTTYCSGVKLNQSSDPFFAYCGNQLVHGWSWRVSALPRKTRCDTLLDLMLSILGEGRPNMNLVRWSRGSRIGGVVEAREMKVLRSGASSNDRRYPEWTSGLSSKQRSGSLEAPSIGALAIPRLGKAWPPVKHLKLGLEQRLSLGGHLASTV